MATFDGVRHTDHEEAGVWREAQATILYEDDPGIWEPVAMRCG